MNEASLETYTIEPYYGQNITVGKGLPYILLLPRPLSKSQMQLILWQISEFSRRINPERGAVMIQNIHEERL